MKQNLNLFNLIFIPLVFLYFSEPIFSKEFGRLNMFDHYDVRRGLSHNSVNCVFQSKKGFIWIGTAEGLNRFDGYEFKIFKHNPDDTTSLSNNFINTIFYDGKSGFWIGNDEGLDYLDLKSGSFKHYLKDEDFRIVAGAKVNKDILIIKTVSDNGSDLYFFNFRTYKLEEIILPNFELKNGINILHDNSGVVWIITPNAIYKVENLKLKAVINKSPDSYKFTDFKISPNGVMYLSTTKNIYILNKDFSVKSRINIPSQVSNIKFIIPNRLENIWIGYDYLTGLAKYYNDDKSLVFFSNNISSENYVSYTIKCLFIDKSGVVWIGSDGNGITRFNAKKKKFQLLRIDTSNTTSLSRNFPKGLLIDSKDNLWFTSIQGNIIKYDLKSQKSQFFKSIKKHTNISLNSYGNVLYEDSKGTIWNSGSSTIDTFDRSKQEFVKVFGESNSHVIYEDTDGNIWTGSQNKILIRHDLKKNISKSIYEFLDSSSIFKANYVYSIIQTKNKIFWIGTDFGLYKLDIKNKSLKNYNHKKGSERLISSNYILCLLNDSKNRLWAGSKNGLNLYIPEKDHFVSLDNSPGILNSFVYDIIEDKNSDFWISTNKGLSRLKFENINKYNIRNFTVVDGLHSHEFNTNSGSKSSDGYLYFGGIGGINYFHPDSIYDNIYVPKVVLTNLFLFDMPLKTKNEPSYMTFLQLPYYENTLSFEFAALEFSEPYLNQYAYYLEGVDTNWVYSGVKRFARYTNLKPGKYKFKVIASNNDNRWSIEPSYLSIIITPPLWDTLEFRILIVLFITLTIFISYKIHTRQIRQKNTFLEDQIKIRTVELNLKNQLLQKKTKEIQAINESLEKRVQERMTDLREANRILQELLNEITISKSESLKAIIKTQEDERSRFAKDLHDGANQYLTFMKYNLNSIISSLGEENYDIKEKLKEQMKLIDNIVQELRQFAYSLMPPVLERIGLNAALEELLDSYKSSANLDIDYYLQETVKPIPKYYKIHIYRTVQEILNNAIKHSHCTKINVQLLSFPESIILIVEDNGNGFDVNKVKGGMGLKNIDSRIALIKGKLNIDSQINHGTTITIEVPN